MKKSVIIITALVYFVAIIVVAFLGYVAEIHNPPIYAEDIVMVINNEFYKPESESEIFTYYKNGAPIYDILYYPPVEEPAQEVTAENEVLTNEFVSTNTNEFRYIFKFRGFDEYEYFFNTKEKIELNLKPYSSLGECENQSLFYSTDSDYISVDQEGKVSLKKYDDIGLEEILVKTKDPSKKQIKIQIYW